MLYMAKCYPLRLWKIVSLSTFNIWFPHVATHGKPENAHCCNVTNVG